MNIKTLYQDLGEKKFSILTIIFCFMGDVVGCMYIWKKFTNREDFDKAMAMVSKILQQKYGNLPPDMAEQMWQLLVNTLLTCLGFFVLFHCFNYLFYFLGKRFAFLYIRMMSWFAIFGFFLSGLVIVSSTPGFGAVFIIQSLLYLFVAIGFVKFPILPYYMIQLKQQQALLDKRA